MVDLSLAFESLNKNQNPAASKEENTREKRENKELRQWAKLMCAHDWKEAITLAKESETMKEAILTLHELSEDEKIKLQCEARMFYEGDMESAKLEGIQQGVQTINQLILLLTRDGRINDIPKAAADQAYQKQLLEEYGL